MGQIIGIDIGGTKIRTTVFDANWSVKETSRIDTPNTYSLLIDALLSRINWAESVAGCDKPKIGIAVAGMLDRETDLLTTANLPAKGKPIVKDLLKSTNANISVINDCKAFALSESCLGAARAYETVLAVSIGTGLGGAFVVNQQLFPEHNGLAGEYGHMSMPADIVARLSLQNHICGCGQSSCYETYLSGPGLRRLGEELYGTQQTVREWSQDALKNNDDAIELLRRWFELLGSFTSNMQLSHDPECIVFGGGMCNLPNFTERIMSSTTRASRLGGRLPTFLIADESSQSGARGAALVASRSTQ